MKTIMLCVVVAFLTGCESPDYSQGYAHGKAVIRESRKSDPSGGILEAIGEAIPYSPNHPEKSADWNAGYCAGRKAAMEEP